MNKTQILAKSFILVSLAVAATFTGCSSKASYVARDALMEAEAPFALQSNKSAMSSTVYLADSAANFTSESELFERKLIKNANVRIKVKDFEESELQCSQWLSKYQGYVVSSSKGEYYYNITVKIPSQNFDQSLKDFNSVGEVKEKNIYTEDVTDSYYDLESRIETKRILQERLTEYLKNAANMSDMIEIERQLNEVTSELESIEGRMKRLSNQIDYSTVNINMYKPQASNGSSYTGPDFSERFTKFISSISGFFQILLLTLIGIVIFGIPLALLLAFLYWLCFGKLGLIKKLFKMLK